MSMAKPLRAAIVGCGAIACGNDAQWLRQRESRPPLTHAGAYRVNPATTLVAAADVDRARLERFGRDWGVSALYADYRELLRKERVDMLSVCTPTALHAEVVAEAARLGVQAVFCEKPLASDPHEAWAALQACEESGTALAVNYFRRWNPTIEVLAGEFASGELGAIRRVNAFYARGIRNNGTHVLHLIHWLVGPIRAVQAVRFDALEDGDLSADALCLTEGEVPCFLHACHQADFNIFEVDILTDRARVRITENGRRIERYRVSQDPHYAQYTLLDSQPEVTLTAWQVCFSRVVDDLVACLGTGTAPRCGGREAYDALRVAAAIQTSAREGGRKMDVPSIAAPLSAPSGKPAGSAKGLV